MDHRSTGYTGTYDDLTQLFTEKDLLNVTCGALEPDVINVTNDEKNGIYTFLEKTAKAGICSLTPMA